MEISNLTDGDILDFLMLSDFDNLNPEELRFLLLKFRYFYRITSSRNSHLVSDIEMINLKNKNEVSSLMNQLAFIGTQNQQKQLELDSIKNTKLSFWKRINYTFSIIFYGKIKINK